MSAADRARARRRPDRYHPLAEPVPGPPARPADRTVRATLLDRCGDVDAVVGAAVAAAAASDLVVLPALPTSTDGTVGDHRRAAEDDERLLAELAAGLTGTDAVVCTTVVEVTHGGPSLVAVGVAAGGVVLHQPVLHPGPAGAWAAVTGDRQKVLSVPTGPAGRRVDVEVSVLGGDDPAVPEAARLACLGGAEVLALCWDGPDAPLREALAVTRAYENGAVVLLASRGGVLAVAGDGTVRPASAGLPVEVPIV